MTAASSRAAGQDASGESAPPSTIASTDVVGSPGSAYIRTSGSGVTSSASRAVGSRRVPQTSSRAPDADSTVCTWAAE